MRILTIIAALAASTLLGGWSFDRQGPYCLPDRQSMNCGYPSLEACVVTTPRRRWLLLPESEICRGAPLPRAAAAAEQVAIRRLSA